jgi:alpha-1,2-mannosyltransferase
MVWQDIKSGAWLTGERRRVYPLILLALFAAAALIWIALADGLVDRNGHPIGTDFSNVWAAGKLALDGASDAPYDLARQYAAEKAIFGDRDVPLYGWHYPPVFLLIAAALALIPYGAALFVWSAITLSAYLAAIRAILPGREAMLIALAFPAVFVNLGHGQNGCLTAALIGGGLVLLDTRPLIAGALFGLLACKPQFGALIPLVLVVTGRWRAVASAATTAIVTSAASLALFGVKAWSAFVASAGFTRTVVLEAGGPGWEKIQSLFAAVRMWGGSVELAYAAHTALLLAVAASLIWLWRSRAQIETKAAALACACLLTTPYVLDYDLVVLAVAIAFLVRHGLARGFRDYDITVLALAWLAPLIARVAAGTLGLPLGLISVLAVYVLALRGAVHGLAANRPRSGSLVEA